MQLFLGEIANGFAILEGDEARHASKVLRKKPGDFIEVIDGFGPLYNCKIVELQRDKLLAEVVKTTPNFGYVPYQLHVAIAPTKNIDRLEWFLEKATEMGVSSIFPIVSKNSERTVIKPERLEKVLLSAAKQSLKGVVPLLHPLQKMKDFVKQDFIGNKYIAHCAEGEKVNFLAEVNPAKPTLICIGPEGDFTKDEIELATQAGFVPVALGNARLRTETAGLVAVAAMYSKVV